MLEEWLTVQKNQGMTMDVVASMAPGEENYV